MGGRIEPAVSERWLSGLSGQPAMREVATREGDARRHRRARRDSESRSGADQVTLEKQRGGAALREWGLAAFLRAGLLGLPIICRPGQP